MKASDFMRYKNWVVAGDVDNNTKYAYRILNALKQKNYNVAGVNPRSKSETALKSLKEIDFKIEVLDLCINPLAGIDIVKQAYELSIDKILIQPGAESKEILDYCKSNNIYALEGCALVELSNL